MYRNLCYYGFGLLILEAAVSPLHANEITSALARAVTLYSSQIDPWV